jgi:hypothetical protein
MLRVGSPVTPGKAVSIFAKPVRGFSVPLAVNEIGTGS